MPMPPMTEIGFHYFPDAEHYRRQDLSTWLPRLQAIGARWVVLQGSSQRAIPEFFLRGLLDAGLQVVIHIPHRLNAPLPDLQVLLDAYAHWGVQYIMPFQRPNQRAADDEAASWLAVNPVTRFVTRFLPLAKQVHDLGMWTVTPPLQPGGNYWDTSFLRAALTEIATRAPELTDHLVIGLVAHAGERPLNWGAGGPERWPGARPYFTPSDEQDQRGFAIFDWYNAIVQAVYNRRLPLMAFEAGSPGDLQASPSDEQMDAATHRERTLHLMQAIDAPTTRPPDVPPLPDNLLACHFPAIAANLPHACYIPDGQPTPLGEVRLKQPRPAKKAAPAKTTQTPVAPATHPIAHYVLLPLQARREETWQNAVLPALLRSGVTIGFSPREAALARQVTILSNGSPIADEIVHQLRVRGCQVVVLSGSGTELAQFLSNTFATTSS